jgi:CDP-glucose 4,6-dehydratase
VAIVTSDKCYENREHVWPYRENEAMGGHDPYSASKGCAEIAASAYARTYFAEPGQARVASVRAGNVIGGGDWAADRLIPDLIRAAVAKETVQIRNPSAVRPWQHVLEPLSGYLLAMERVVAAERWTGFDAWNFGPNPGEELPVRDVVERFRAAWGDAPEVVYGEPRPGEHEAGLLRVDSTKAKSELGWRPIISNGEAVDTVVRWMQGFKTMGDARARCLHDIEHMLGL